MNLRLSLEEENILVTKVSIFYTPAYDRYKSLMEVFETREVH
jgi:hypothetical protein